MLNRNETLVEGGAEQGPRAVGGERAARISAAEYYAREGALHSGARVAEVDAEFARIIAREFPGDTVGPASQIPQQRFATEGAYSDQTAARMAEEAQLNAEAALVTASPRADLIAQTQQAINQVGPTLR